MPPGSTEQRRLYQSFWAKYSGRADNTSMLLNANADELAELDRAEILSLLPDFGDKFVVDIGAGIGRFTTEFAKRAGKVVSTDFVDTFIAKNREWNGHFQNIEWRVGDALGLEFENASVDFVFTNWLLMYLSDEEAIRFLANVFRWLRPGGHLHLRESCSEPSTGKSNTSGTSLHSQTEANPTKYRFSSAYIQLLQAFRIHDSGKAWRFHIHWACSVGVYIEKNCNWRQVHWLVSKVPADEPVREMELTQLLSEEWPSEQLDWDNQLDMAIQRNQTLTINIAKMIMDSMIGPDPTLFVLNGRQNAKQFGLDPHTLADQFGCRIWAVESHPFCYRHALTQANRLRDKRVRIAWHPSLAEAFAFWMTEESAGFNGILAVNLLTKFGIAEELQNLTAILQNDALLVCLEAKEFMDSEEGQNKLELLEAHFSIENGPRLHLDDWMKDEMVLLVAKKKAKALASSEWKQPISTGY